jgi:hypothetical protein
MNIEEAYEKVKSLFSIPVTVTETDITTIQVVLKDTKLEDGTIIRYDKLDVDGKLEVINEDGTTTPLSDGEYTIDGFDVIIVGGLVTESKPVAEAEETPVAEAEETPVAEAEAEETPDLKVLEERIAKLEEMIAMITEGMTEVKQTQTQKIEELQTKLSEMEMTPAVESITKVATSTPKVSKFDILSSALDAMKKK